MDRVAQSEQSIFHAALDFESDAEQARFVEQACGADQQLRAAVEALLVANRKSGDLLDAGAPFAATLEPSAAETTGTMIGPYKLKERLGAGGMGIVWAAEQKQPLRRKVALKVIKPGMDSELVIARFEAEREALSMMDHPNIARVLDAGMTPQQRPYFVMELIRGVPITDFCDANRLSVSERLKLFIQVCKAVQHAHQKGIIHRDIKPSNVLVTLHDEKPVPKVIDFGVAKALHHSLTERSVYTGVFQAVGTLAYMSPEQAQLSGLDVDTRADIYGLGVLLYELLTGETPFDKDQLASAALNEACRIIREDDPAKPSTKVSTLDDRNNAVFRQRRTSRDDLGKIIRGDLDWIVMRALEKDRTRRYDTASSLADDVQRHLTDEVVEARPPSTAYKIRKYIARNKTLVASTAAVTVSLALGLVFALWGFRQSTSLARELSSTLSELSDVMFEQGMVDALSGNPDQARTAAARLREIGHTELDVQLRALTFVVEEKWDDAQQLLEPAVALSPSSVALQALLTSAYGGQGDINRWFIGNQRLGQLASGTSRDNLFRTIATLDLDPQQACELLDEIVRTRRSPVALLYRGKSRARLAQKAGRVELIDDSLADIAQARTRLGTSGIVGVYALEAHLRTASAARAAGQVERSTQIMSRAAEIVADLESQSARSAWKSTFLAHYYVVHGQTDRALQHLRFAGDELGSDTATSRYLALSFEVGHAPDEDVVSRLLTDESRPFSKIAHAFLRAAEGRSDEALAIVNEVFRTDKTLDATSLGLVVLHACGKFEEASRVGADLIERWRDKQLDRDREWIRDRATPYFVGEPDDAAADRLLRQARSAPMSRFTVSIAHSQIAATMLARNKLEQAREHMAQCLAQGEFTIFDYRMWAAIAARMEAKQEWPLGEVSGPR